MFEGTALSKQDNKKKQKHTTHHIRHKFFYRLLRPLVGIFLKCKFRYKYKKAKHLPKNYIVLSNHTTDFDPIFVSVSFKKQMYFVASEHLTRWGKTFKLLDFAFNPIIRYKGTVASSTVMEVLRRVKHGENVCLFAEGVRTWDGETGTILPSTAKMIKSAKCGLVTYKIVGGYFVSPNWSEGSKTRKGKISGSVVNVYTAEQLAQMTEEEVYKIINNDLYENAYETQSKEMHKYKGKNLAEKLENLIFICPHCKAHDTLKSTNNTVTCSKCNKEFKYNEYGMLEGIPYDTVYKLARWQEEQISEDIKNQIPYTIPEASIYKIERNHSKELLSSGELSFDTEKLKCGTIEFSSVDIQDMAIYGRHGIVFTHDNLYYEILPNKNYCALKYILYFKHLKDIKSNN